MTTALEAVRARRSWSKVTDAAPTHAELLDARLRRRPRRRPLVAAALAAHRAARDGSRAARARAINKADGDKGSSSKPLRAPLLIAVVASYRKSDKVPRWEQEAVASGVAHVLSLLLDEAGWGVIWRTGHYTRSKPVAKAHGLGKNEELLGWLYVGGKPPRARLGRRRAVDARHHVSRLPAGKRPALSA